MTTTVITHLGHEGFSVMCSECTEILYQASHERMTIEGTDTIATEAAAAAESHRCEGSAVH